MGASELVGKSRKIYNIWSNKIKVFLDVMRIGPALNCLLLVFVGVFLHPEAFEWITAVLSTIVMFFVYSLPYLYNYFTDIEEDKLNNKYNPVVDNTYRYIISAYILFALVATIIISLKYLGIIPFAVVIFYLIMGFIYSTRPFRIKERFFLKNVLIGLSWGLLLLVMTSSLTGTIAAVDLIMVAFFGIISLLGSTISDFRDIKGDREAGVRTVPVVLGRRRTGHYFLVWMIIQLLVIVVPVALGLILPIYLLVLIAMLPRFRLVYSIYSQNTEQIQHGPEMPGSIITTIVLFGVALIRAGFF